MMSTYFIQILKLYMVHVREVYCITSLDKIGIWNGGLTKSDDKEFDKKDSSSMVRYEIRVETKQVVSRFSWLLPGVGARLLAQVRALKPPLEHHRGGTSPNWARALLFSPSQALEGLVASLIELDPASISNSKINLGFPLKQFLRKSI